MKKTIILTIILLIIFAVPQYSYAESYDFNDGGITIDLADDLKAYTKDSDLSEVPEVPEQFDLLVRSETLDYYWFFYYMTGKNAIDFSGMTDDQILQLVENDSTDIETDNVKTEIYDNGQKYLVIDSINEETNEHIHYYVTGAGNALYYFIAPSKDETLSEAQKADLRSALDGVTFAKKEAPTELDERRAAMIRIIKRFAFAFGALAIFVVIKLAVEKIRGK